jgi:iron-sulfur cluster insertion protein
MYDMILTENAVAKIKEFAEAEGLPLSIRVSVKGGGCGGMIFDMVFSDPNELDEVLEFSDIKIICDQLSFQYMNEITIDYINSPFGEGFKFIGGEIKSTCGCGKSYSF